MSDASINSNLEEAFKNSDWSTVCAALMPRFNDYLARRSKNVFACEQVNSLEHVFTVPALYDDQAGLFYSIAVFPYIFCKVPYLFQRTGLRIFQPFVHRLRIFFAMYHFPSALKTTDSQSQTTYWPAQPLPSPD